MYISYAIQEKCLTQGVQGFEPVLGFEPGTLQLQVPYMLVYVPLTITGFQSHHTHILVRTSSLLNTEKIPVSKLRVIT